MLSNYHPYTCNYIDYNRISREIEREREKTMHSLKQLSAKLSLETYVLAQLYGIRLGFCGTYQFSSGYHF